MGQLEQQHAEHKARLDRLWNPTRRAITPTPAPAMVTPPTQVEPPNPPMFDDQHEARLLDLQKEVRDLGRRISAELSTLSPQPTVTPPRPSVQTIIKTVATYYRVSIKEIYSQRRDLYIVRPRQIAMYLAHHLTARSMPDIGRKIGGRDHTTILSGIRRIKDLRRLDPKMDADISALTALLTMKATAIVGDAGE